MRGMGLQGVIRGKPVKTTISDKAAACPLDHVKRLFKAPRPNTLWVSDFTYVATWSGFAWFDHRRLLEPIGNIPPAEAEALY
jgi:putative transposase